MLPVPLLVPLPAPSLPFPFGVSTLKFRDFPFSALEASRPHRVSGAWVSTCPAGKGYLRKCHGAPTSPTKSMPAPIDPVFGLVSGFCTWRVEGGGLGFVSPTDSSVPILGYDCPFRQERKEEKRASKLLLLAKEVICTELPIPSASVYLKKEGKVYRHAPCSLTSNYIASTRMA